MVKRLPLLLALCFVLGSTRVDAQENPFNIAVTPDKLAFLITQLYGPNGLIVDSLRALPSGATYSAHFNSDFQTGFTQFNTALASQIVNVPLPSPASSFTYEFDSTLGVFTRTTQSFGPILAERWETIGGKRIFLRFYLPTFHLRYDGGLRSRQRARRLYPRRLPAPRRPRRSGHYHQFHQRHRKPIHDVSHVRCHRPVGCVARDSSNQH